MDISSPPAFREEAVRDLDLAFLAGPIQSFTLHADDTLEELPDRLVLTISEPVRERLEFYRAALAWVSSRQRIIRHPVDLQTALAISPTDHANRS